MPQRWRLQSNLQVFARASLYTYTRGPVSVLPTSTRALYPLSRLLGCFPGPFGGAALVMRPKMASAARPHSHDGGASGAGGASVCSGSHASFLFLFFFGSTAQPGLRPGGQSKLYTGGSQRSLLTYILLSAHIVVLLFHATRMYPTPSSTIPQWQLAIQLACPLAPKPINISYAWTPWPRASNKHACRCAFLFRFHSFSFAACGSPGELWRVGFRDWEDILRTLLGRSCSQHI